jgi:hypothetical protein
MEGSLKRQKASVQAQLSHLGASASFPASSVMRISSQSVVQVAPSTTCAFHTSSQHASLAEQIEHVALEQGIAIKLLQAVAQTESGFAPCALSPKGAMGIMQIMPETARDLGLANPWDSQQNLTAGAKYLRQLLARYNGDLRLALGAYNAGPGQVDRAGDVPPIPETQEYVQKVLSRIHKDEGVLE